ncbi:unnamed protein product [Nippostrongylus brasiliensis]|uniref:CRAL-TRIO domain-containing protein n=1 Tax=Nippostrongylus brasiliensis TaxID=27835 RepID=A0A0N4Y6W4_NIPBR|nr:unnamed protein product [Nippostrongylus brasiliensis]
MLYAKDLSVCPSVRANDRVQNERVERGGRTNIHHRTRPKPVSGVMTRRFSTAFGEPLSDESVRYVNEVRQRITQPISAKFNTDFNIFRFVLSAERLHKKEKDIDNQPVRGFDENPMFIKKLMPKGEILDARDSQNRLLWYIEYATITVESIAHALQSSQACKYQFWQFEYMLRKVMAQEEKTGRLSGIRHVVDMNGYEINPFTMAMMPAGFSDKFRLHDNNFLKSLTEEIDIENIPTTLGGKNEDIVCIGAQKVPHNEYWVPENPELLHHLEHLHIPAKKTRHISLDITEPKTLNWYFRTDGDVFFGIFYEGKLDSNENHHIEVDSLEMIYPWLKLSAKLVHERDSLVCQRSGRYHIVFCNRHSWFSRRTVEHYLYATDAEEKAHRVHSDGSLSSAIHH